MTPLLLVNLEAGESFTLTHHHEINTHLPYCTSTSTEASNQKAAQKKKVMSQRYPSTIVFHTDYAGNRASGVLQSPHQLSTPKVHDALNSQNSALACNNIAQKDDRNFIKP